MAVVAAGVGDVGEPGASEDAGDQVADGGVGVRLVPGADSLEILAPYPATERPSRAAARQKSY